VRGEVLERAYAEATHAELQPGQLSGDKTQWGSAILDELDMTESSRHSATRDRTIHEDSHTHAHLR
jgi:hypothetical protein